MKWLVALQILMAVVLIALVAIQITLVYFDKTHPNRPCGEVTDARCWK